MKKPLRVIWACPYCMPDVFTRTKKEMLKECCEVTWQLSGNVICEDCPGPVKYVRADVR